MASTASRPCSARTERIVSSIVNSLRSPSCRILLSPMHALERSRPAGRHIPITTAAAIDAWWVRLTAHSSMPASAAMAAARPVSRISHQPLPARYTSMSHHAGRGPTGRSTFSVASLAANRAARDSNEYSGIDGSTIVARLAAADFVGGEHPMYSDRRSVQQTRSRRRPTPGRRPPGATMTRPPSVPGRKIRERIGDPGVRCPPKGSAGRCSSDRFLLR